MMKSKKKLLCISLTCLPLLLASCGNSQNTPEPTPEPESKKEEREVIDPVIPTKTVSELAENEYNKVPLYYLSKLGTYKSYKAVTKGDTVAQFLFIKVTQSIDVTVIKGEDYSYMMNESHSSQINTSHECWYHTEEAVYRDNGETNYHHISMENYLNKYGTEPFEIAMEGYRISEKSIKAVTKLESEENYKFKVEFNPDEASKYVTIQMKQFGGLDAYPIIAGVEMVVTLKNDFTPLQLDLTSQYTAQKLVSTSCTQNYTVTYSNYGETLEIPGLNEAKPHFNDPLEK